MRARSLIIPAMVSASLAIIALPHASACPSRRCALLLVRPDRGLDSSSSASASLAQVNRHLRALALTVAAATVALAVPATALAHIANIEYRFPLPVWLYGLAGMLVVLLSAPAAAYALRREPRVGEKNYYPLLRRVLPGAFLRALTMALLALVILAGFFSSALGVENPAVLLIWVDLWVGLGLVSALVANVWDFLSPLANLGRTLDAYFARRGTAARPYPEEFGVWPSVGLLIGFSWAELVWRDSRDPNVVAALVLAYCIVQLGGMARYGAEVWLSRAELFTVFARTFARLAPIEFYAYRGAEPCVAARCPDQDERIGCASCFSDAPPGKRGVRLRSFGAGIFREPSLGRGGAAFVVALLATVVFDGLRGTGQYARLEGQLTNLIPRLDLLDQTRGTLMMIFVVSAFALVYMLASALVSVLEDGGGLEIGERYAPTLIPIAAAYFVAHYLLYLFYVGQLTPRVVLDPGGSGWFPEYRPWVGIPGSYVWAFQVAAIVIGHVVAVVAAHRVAKPFHETARGVLVAQLPFLALMVLYTFTGLWVLGQALQGGQ